MENETMEIIAAVGSSSQAAIMEPILMPLELPKFIEFDELILHMLM